MTKDEKYTIKEQIKYVLRECYEMGTYPHHRDTDVFNKNVEIIFDNLFCADLYYQDASKIEHIRGMVDSLNYSYNPNINNAYVEIEKMLQKANDGWERHNTSPFIVDYNVYKKSVGTIPNIFKDSEGAAKEIKILQNCINSFNEVESNKHSGYETRLNMIADEIVWRVELFSKYDFPEIKIPNNILEFINKRNDNEQHR